MISNLRQAYKLKRTNVRLNVYTRLRSTVVACERLLCLDTWVFSGHPGFNLHQCPLRGHPCQRKKIIQNKVVEFVYQSL